MTRVSVTTGLELAGLLVLAGAAALEVAKWTIPGGFGVGGVLLICESAFVTWRTPRVRAKSGDETA